MKKSELFVLKNLKSSKHHEFLLYLSKNAFFICFSLLFFSVSVFLSMLVKRVSKLATLAGSCTAWSTAFNQMDKCQVTKPLVAETTPSILSSVKLERGSTSHEQFLWIWNRL